MAYTQLVVYSLTPHCSAPPPLNMRTQGFLQGHVAVGLGCVSVAEKRDILLRLAKPRAEVFAGNTTVRCTLRMPL